MCPCSFSICIKSLISFFVQCQPFLSFRSRYMNWKNTKLKHGEVRMSVYNVLIVISCSILEGLKQFYLFLFITELYLQDSFKPLVSISPNAR